MMYETMPLGAIAANCTVLWIERKPDCWIIDPGGDAADLLAFLDARGLVPAGVVLTHGHFDHIGAIPGLLKRWPGLPVHIGPGDVPMIGHPENAWGAEYPRIERPATLVADLTDGATLSFAGLSADILATPGHTPGSVCVRFSEARLLFTGDTLFAGSCGRTDFPGGSPKDMHASLRRLAALAPDFVVLPGHGATSTIGREVVENPYLQAD